MTTRQGRTPQTQTSRHKAGLLSDIRRLIAGATGSTSALNRDRYGCYALVRQERLVVGPTTQPYPIHHETILMTSDSLVELRNLCDRIAGDSGGSEVEALEPCNWIDAIPGEKVFSYAIRRA